MSIGGERRRAYRSQVRLWVFFRQFGMTTRINAAVSDLSMSGFRMRTSAIVTVGSTIYLKITSFAPQEAVVTWEHGEDYGCEFTHKLHQAVVDHIAAASSSSKEFVAV